MQNVGFEDRSALIYSSLADRFVVATSSETAQNTQFTSYVSRDGDSDLLKTTQIWQAARATSAASSFFAPINIGPNKEEFVDGAVGANNPVEVLWDEARELWSQDRLEDNVRCIVSIGTGEPTLSAFGNKFWEIAKTLKEVATETERTANAFQNRHFDLVQANRYYRFNVKHGLENVGLEEWAQRDKIVAVTRHYLRTGVQRDFHNFKAVNTEPCT